MSTEFRTTSTDEMAFARWFAGSDRGAAFEFGSMTNFERCCSAADAGDTFTGDDGSRQAFTRQDFEAMAADGRATFGEFCCTFEMGSGDFMTFFEEA
jgi:hypothetical protein